MNYTDIHCHLAWGIDDGIADRENAAKALEAAAEDGIKTIVSTPHLYPGFTGRKEFDELNSRIDDLSDFGREYGITVLRGCEFHINDEALDWIEEGLYNRIGDSRYLLCEFNPRVDISEIPYADDMLYELLVRGISPVIAHVERYFHHVDCERVRNWINMGCYIQVNRTSIMGYQSREALKNSLTLIEEGLCHFVATDAHRAEGNRIMRLSDAYEKTVSISGEKNGELLFRKNPEALIKNIEPADMEIFKQGFFSRLKGKYGK